MMDKLECPICLFHFAKPFPLLRLGVAEATIANLDNAGAVEESSESASKTGDPTRSSTLPCAFVVGVLARNWRDYVCTFVPREDRDPVTEEIPSAPGWIVVTPWDRRIPRVRLFTSEPAKLQGQR